MNSFFIDLYKYFQKMGGNGKDIDHMLANLPWKKQKKEDGTIYYICEIKEGKNE